MNEAEIKEILDCLREKYREDADILSGIDREEVNIRYLLKMEQEPGYNGQTALQHLRMFIAELECWN